MLSSKIRKIILENTGIKQTIFKNTFWMIVSEAVNRLTNMLLLIYAARILGVFEYGRFTFALSFTALLAIFADLGLYEIVTREFSHQQDAEKDFPSIISLKILMTLASFVLMFLAAFLISSDPFTRRIIWIFSFFTLISSFFSIFFAFLRARQKMEYEALLVGCQNIFIVSICSFALYKFPSITNFSIAYLSANIAALAITLLFFHKRIFPLALGFDKKIWKKFLSLSWPLTLGFSTGWLYIYINSVVMGYFGQLEQSGWYNAAYKIIGALIISAMIISRSFYPALTRLFKVSKEHFSKIWILQMDVMTIIALPVLAGGFILAPRIIGFFYTPDYAPSVLAFQILLFVCVINFIYYPFAVAVVIAQRQTKLFYYMLFGIILNTALSVILVPSHGFLGAGAAAVLSSLITLILVAIESIKAASAVPINLGSLKIFLSSVLASAAMAALVAWRFVYNLNVLIAIFFGVITYFLILGFLNFNFVRRFAVKLKNI